MSDTPNERAVRGVLTWLAMGRREGSTWHTPGPALLPPILAREGLRLVDMWEPTS